MPLLLSGCTNRLTDPFDQSPNTMNEFGGHGLTDREEMETSLIRALISSYFSIVRQTIQDLVPKAIMR